MKPVNAISPHLVLGRMDHNQCSLLVHCMERHLAVPIIVSLLYIDIKYDIILQCSPVLFHISV